MALKSYNEPAVRVYGSLGQLTQVIGTADGDFINNINNVDTGSVSLTCTFNPLNCVEDPDGPGPGNGTFP